MLHLALSLALATCPAPPEGTILTDDAELAVALDAADRAAWALRDAETLLFARRAWNAREGRLRAAGEASAHGDIDARFVDRLLELVDTTATADGSLVATGQTIAGVALPDLRGLDVLPVDEALAVLTAQADALVTARSARIAAASEPCGLYAISDPGSAATSGNWGPYLEATSERHVANQSAGALAQADHTALTLEGLAGRIVALARRSASETLDNGERSYVQERFVALSETADQLAARGSWHGHPLHAGQDTDIALPDLTAPTLGIDTGTLDLSTSSSASAAVVGVEVGTGPLLAEAREGFAADLASLDTLAPRRPRVRADGAVAPLGCDTVADVLADLAATDAALAAWDRDATARQQALATVRAHTLRVATDARPADLDLPDPGPVLGTLAAAPGPDQLEHVGLHGRRTIEVPGLDTTFVVDSDNLPATADLLTAQERLAADRWRVHTERLFLRADEVQLAREAALCELVPPPLTPAAAPDDPSMEAIDAALRRNRRDAGELVATALDHTSEAIDVLEHLEHVLYELLDGPGPADPAVVEAEADALAAAFDTHGTAGWLHLPFDGSEGPQRVTVSPDAVHSFDVVLPDLTPFPTTAAAWIADARVAGSESELQGDLAVTLDVLRYEQALLQAAQERLEIEAFLADGP